MKTALLIIDVINSLDYPEGKKLLKTALPAAKNILRLKNKLKKKNIPVIYVNDHFGEWRSNWEEVFQICSAPQNTGAKLCEILKPEADDYFVLKPKHSGFFSSNLEILLEDLKVKKLIIVGIAGNICVLFTVNDAHMRGYEIHVPHDCIASNSKKDNDYALRQFKDVFKIKISASQNI